MWHGRFMMNAQDAIHQHWVDQHSKEMQYLIDQITQLFGYLF